MSDPTPAERSGGRRTGSTAAARLRSALEVRSSLLVCAAAVAPFTAFAHDNRFEALSLDRLALYAAVVAVVALGLHVALTALRPTAAHRVAASVAALVTMCFQYRPFQVLDEERGWGLQLWLVLTVALVVLVGRLARSEGFYRFLSTMVVLWAALPAAAYVVHRATTSGSGPVGSAEAVYDVAVGADDLDDLPNVYVFMLDEYSRADVLDEFFGYDDGPFLDELRARGFTVVDDALTHYSVTALAVSTALDGAYTALEDGDVSGGLRPYVDVVRGDNRLVRTFRSLGYELWYAPPGGEEWLDCTERLADVCLSPITSDLPVGTLELALAATTPLARLELERGAYNHPVHVVDELAERDWLDRGPILLYAHILSPHPPYRFLGDCTKRDKAIDDLSLRHNPLYVEETECLGRRVVTAVDRIVEADPDALIVVMSDHGLIATQYYDALENMPTSALRQRYGALFTLRTPGCEISTAGPGPDLIALGPLLVGCVTDTEIPVPDSRFFYYLHGWDHLDEVSREGLRG